MCAFALSSDLHLVDLGVYLPQRRVLVLADLHLGFEDALREDGVFVPRHHLSVVRERLARLLATLEVHPAAPLQKIVLNGDVRHRFGPLSAWEQQELRWVMEYLLEHAQELVLVAGNHDPALGPLQRALPRTQFAREYAVDSYLFLHGDRVPPSLPATTAWVGVGHEHPAVSLRDPVTNRTETYKCFLVGPFRQRRLLVQPSFNQLVKGTDLTKEETLSPFLRGTRLGDFAVYLVGDDGKIYDFGRLRRLL